MKKYYNYIIEFLKINSPSISISWKRSIQAVLLIELWNFSTTLMIPIFIFKLLISIKLSTFNFITKH
ncbi:hypothetical protein LEP1GSC166_2375 [Leptospira kirschneri]|nr:hypothetical protein LEP1GSC166_2375 [Leptospira kirschneri]